MNKQPESEKTSQLLRILGIPSEQIKENTMKQEEKHECEFHSACCDAPPAAGMYETGRCGRCGDPTGFDCACGELEERGNTIRGVKG